MDAGGILVNPGIGKLSLPQMVSPATARVINKNLFRNTGNDWDKWDEEFSTMKIVCEIAPNLSYAGEGLEKVVKGKSFFIPVSLT